MGTSTKKSAKKPSSKKKAKPSAKQRLQATVNIGMVGHVDHGKTTLVKTLSGVWTDRHSEELRRGISIKLGYADTTFRKCPKCRGIEAYTVEETCPKHNIPTNILRRLSFVDAPGHEILLATMISGAALMDGAILVVAANEECPQPQTAEHLDALLISGLDPEKIIVVQNKIELVTPAQAEKNYQQIRKFLAPTAAAKVPVIPISAIAKANIDLLIKTIEDRIPTPKHDLERPGRMYIARSFEVNLPGTRPEDLRGGVIGGTIIQGRFTVGDKIEICPGFQKKHGGKTFYEPIITKITSLQTGLGEMLDEAIPGGLIGIGTQIDPYFTKTDGLVGNVAGKPGTLPKISYKLLIKQHLMRRVVGSIQHQNIKAITARERLMINIGTTVTAGTVSSTQKKLIQVDLIRPVCAEKGQRVALSRNFGGRWRLIGYGFIEKTFSDEEQS
ncbi:MAG: translation initiation factor IF-2 subunit gamma [Candidatus Ranarchaeia archaeon]